MVEGAIEVFGAGKTAKESKVATKEQIKVFLAYVFNDEEQRSENCTANEREHLRIPSRHPLGDVVILVVLVVLFLALALPNYLLGRFRCLLCCVN